MRTLLIIVILTLTGNAFSQDSINQYDKAGKRHGWWIKKYPNGNIRYKGRFIHGKETGIFHFYAPDNPKQPIAEKDYTQSDDFIYVTFYQKNGKKESEGQMKEKKRTGTWIFYFADGKTILSTEEYRDGKLNGVQKTYYRNGQLAKEVHYHNGKKDGTTKTFGQNGKLLELITYKNGKADGPSETYDENGNLYSKGQYSNGLKTGEWEFHINGKIIRTTHPNWIHRKE